MSDVPHNCAYTFVDDCPTCRAVYNDQRRLEQKVERLTAVLRELIRLYEEDDWLDVERWLAEVVAAWQAAKEEIER